MATTPDFAPTELADDGAAAELAEELRVVVRSGINEGALLRQPLPLAAPLTIGSDLDCDLVLAGDDISPLHAMLYAARGALWLVRAPGAGAVQLDGAPLQEAPRQLQRGTRLLLGSTELEVLGRALPEALPVATAAAAPVAATRAQRLRAHAAGYLAAATCAVAGVGLVVLALADAAPRPEAAPAVLSAGAAAPDPALALRTAAAQVESYLAEPALRVRAVPPRGIEISGTARGAASKQRIDKLARVLPAGIELSVQVSYPKEEAAVTGPDAGALPLSSLSRKVLQVAASERVPFIEIGDGERVFEGGQLNGYELLRIAPHEIVARRDGRIQSFKVE